MPFNLKHGLVLDFSSDVLRDLLLDKGRPRSDLPGDVDGAVAHCHADGGQKVEGLPEIAHLSDVRMCGLSLSFI